MNMLQTLTTNLAASLNIGGVSSDELVKTLKATAFKGDVSDAQMAALMVVASQYSLNPWTKEIYAFPDKKNGIVPVVGVDGWSRIINSNPVLDGIEFRFSETLVTPDGAKSSCPEWIECAIYKKGFSRPVVVREYIDECYRPPFKSDKGYQVDGPWQSHPKRFLRHKALIQCARIAFGFVGIYDQDEAERIIEKDMGQAQVVTPEIDFDVIEAEIGDIDDIMTLGKYCAGWKSKIGECDALNTIRALYSERKKQIEAAASPTPPADQYASEGGDYVA